MGIRAAQASDMDAILDIYNEAVLHSTATFEIEPRSKEAQVAWFEEHVPPYPAIVWEDEGRVLGWGSLSRYASRCGYRFTGEVSVYVHVDARGRGIGKTLLSELVRLGEVHGMHTLIGVVAVENDVSRHLAEKTGFVQVGLLEQVGYKFDRWLDVRIYQLRFGS